MSRCFPFPPPGYERKEKTERVSLPEVKHQEKIKREKKDRYKREGKDKKRNDRSEHKHNDKKERKEKHKNKKKEKYRDKDKSSRVAETDEQNHVHHDGKLVDRRTNHFKLAEESLNRTADDEKVAAINVVENSNGSVKRSNPELVAAITIAENLSGNNVLRSSSDYSRKGIDDKARRAKFNCSTQKVEIIGSTNLPHRERSSVDECAQKHNILGQTGTNDMGLPVEKSMVVHNKMEVSNSSISDGIKKIKTIENFSNSNIKVQKTINGAHKSTEILPNIVHQDVGIVQHAAKMADGEINKRPHIIAEDRRLDGRDSKLGNITEKWIKGKDEEKGADNRKEEGNTSKEHKHKKKKDKNKHKDKESKKTKKSEKSDKNHKMQDPRDDAKRNRIDSTSVNLSNLQTVNGKRNSTEENINKRKEFATNGLSHENYEWPNKLPGTTSSLHIVENGKTLQLSNSALPCPSKSEALNGVTEVKIHVDKKGHMNNGITQTVDSKKSKKIETNGLLHENGGLPNKLPRTSSPPRRVKNDREMQLTNSALACPSAKSEAFNGITEVKIVVDKKSHMKNDARQSVDSKKRKEFETSSLSHENYGWSNKLPRTSSPPHIVENGWTMQLATSALPGPSTKAEVVNGNTEVKILVDKKSRMKNGLTQAIDSKNPVVPDTKATKVTLRSSHPDTKYLREIYSVPEMNEWSECDEQKWLFNNPEHRLESNMKAKIGETPEVWSGALRIESDDVVILPYVIPF